MATARVLVVDDEPFVVDLTAQILTQSGYEVVRAADGRTALEIVKTPPPVDLVLSDVVMPGMQGPELVEAVKQASPSTAIMLMSGYTAAGPAQNVPLLQKPFLPRDLVAAVQRTLAEAAQARQESARTIERSQGLRKSSEQLRREFARMRQETQEAMGAAQDLVERLKARTSGKP